MTDKERKEITHVVAQLRHMYSHLVNGRVAKPVMMADGLLSPQIATLERLLKTESEAAR